MSTSTRADISVIADLRALLAERFQSAAHVCAPVRKALATGIEEWDAQTQGLRLGEVTEICGGLGGTGLVLDALLAACAEAGWLGALVDAGDTFEVCDWQPLWLRRTLWVRCGGAASAFKAADMLLRDGNVSWVVLDLQGLSPLALRRIAGSHWHRFHRLVEQRGNALLVLTPSPMVEGAKVRVATTVEWTLEALERPRQALQAEAQFRVFERGRTPMVADFRKTA